MVGGEDEDGAEGLVLSYGGDAGGGEVGQVDGLLCGEGPGEYCAEVCEVGGLGGDVGVGDGEFDV